LLLVLEVENSEVRVDLILKLAVALEPLDKDMCLEVYSLAIKEARQSRKALEALLDYFKKTKRYGKAFMVEQRLEKLKTQAMDSSPLQEFSGRETTAEGDLLKTRMLLNDQDLHKTHRVPPPPIKPKA
jgi:hypothetical protein